MSPDPAAGLEPDVPASSPESDVPAVTLEKDATEQNNRRANILLTLLLVPLVAASAVSAILLWPSERTTPSAEAGPPPDLVSGTITAIDRKPCPDDPLSQICRDVEVKLTSGPEKGNTIVLPMTEGPGQPALEEGDKLIVGRTVDPSLSTTYYFVDFERRAGLIGLAIAFAVLVVLVARWRGLGALAGLVVTFAIVSQFIIPSILEGNSAVAVALTGGSVIILTVLYIAHGFSTRTTTAVIGTLLSMAVTGLLAVVGVAITHLSGMSSEEASYVQSFAGRVNIQGLLLGGMILGALGVLNDMTVTQSSAVWEIAAAQPLRKRFDLYRSGMRVGRDHIASTVYTLVLAYTGAALPLLILFVVTGQQFGHVITSDIVAEELVRTLVGSIGLITSVPLTTALAALVVPLVRPQAAGTPATQEPESEPNAPAEAVAETNEGDGTNEGDEASEAAASVPEEDTEQPDEVTASEEVEPVVSAVAPTPEVESVVEETNSEVASADKTSEPTAESETANGIEGETQSVTTEASEAPQKPDPGTRFSTGDDFDQPWTDPDTEASIAEFLKTAPPPTLGPPTPVRRRRWLFPFRRYDAPVGVPRRIGRKERRFWRED